MCTQVTALRMHVNRVPNETLPGKPEMINKQQLLLGALTVSEHLAQSDVDPKCTSLNIWADVNFNFSK